MRRLILSLVAVTCLLSVAWAQNGGSGTSQVSVGQTSKNFIYPYYQDGLLKVTIFAAEATGKTQTREETKDLKIQLYENGSVATTITSPKADIYLSDSDTSKERKMRSKDTVLIVRSDLEASAQNCEFDLVAKKYLLRTNVRVVLKNFDVGAGLTSSSKSATTGDTGTVAAPSNPAGPAHDSMLDSPGSYSNTNSAPTTPTSPAQK